MGARKLSMLSKLKVIDLSTVLAGPSVGMFFAELGAEVIKIEHPTKKDVTRSWKLPTEDKNSPISAYFSSINYNKKLVALDLSNSNDLEKLIELVKSADILLSNFKFGDAEKFGITDKYLSSINPKLIIGKINGLYPVPGAFFIYKGERYKILRAEIGNGIGRPGEIVSDYLEIVCGDKQTIKVQEI